MNWDQESRWTRIRAFLDRTGTRTGAEFAKRSTRVLAELTGADGAWLAVSGDIVAEHRRTSLGEAPVPDEGIRGRGTFVATEGSRAVIRAGLWDGNSRRFGALCVRLADAEPPPRGFVEFIEAVAELLAGRLHEQEQVAEMQERLRRARSTSLDGDAPNLEQLLCNDSMATLRSDIEAAVVGDAPVLILGESGTGKTLLAGAIARASGRAPIVRATLGASDDLNTITSELFGHMRGAFSGAVGARKGLVEYANGGTLILDEILNLPPHAQQLLLDFTQFGTYRPLGYQGREPKVASVRIIAATNGNIRRAIADTRFRQDLYFRLASIPITLRPLRECRAEVPQLAAAYLRRLDRGKWTLSPDAERVLLNPSHEWAGNIRELEGLVQRAVHRARAGGAADHILRPVHFQLEPVPASAPPPAPQKLVRPEPATDKPLHERWAELEAVRADLGGHERELLIEAMRLTAGTQSRAARLLGIPRTGLLSRLSRHGIDKDAYRLDRRVSNEDAD